MKVNPELTWQHPEPLQVLNLQFRFSVSGRASDERIHDSLLEQAADGPHLLLRVPASCLGPGKEFLSYQGLVTDFLWLLSIFLEDFVSAIPHLGTFQNKEVRAEKDTEQDFKIIKPHILVNSPIRHSPNFFAPHWSWSYLLETLNLRFFFAQTERIKHALPQAAQLSIFMQENQQ